MSEDRQPLLSLNRATNVGPGKVCDLGATLAMHSLIAWIDDGRKGSDLHVFLELSHDAVHWVDLGYARLGGSVPFIVISSYTVGQWPGRYVRANIKDWHKGITGLVSATIASA